MKENKEVWLTFKTDKKTHEILKYLSKGLNKTQPELINEICKEYIESLYEAVKSEISKDPT